MAHCIRIKQLENEGDVVYHGAIASLFTGDLPAIEVIKWKDVYDNMLPFRIEGSYNLDYPSWSRDGKRIYCSVSRKVGDVYLVEGF